MCHQLASLNVESSPDPPSTMSASWSKLRPVKSEYGEGCAWTGAMVGLATETAVGAASAGAPTGPGTADPPFEAAPVGKRPRNARGASLTGGRSSIPRKARNWATLSLGVEVRTGAGGTEISKEGFAGGPPEPDMGGRPDMP